MHTIVTFDLPATQRPITRSQICRRVPTRISPHRSVHLCQFLSTRPFTALRFWWPCAFDLSRPTTTLPDPLPPLTISLSLSPRTTSHQVDSVGYWVWHFHRRGLIALEDIEFFDHPSFAFAICLFALRIRHSHSTCDNISICHFCYSVLSSSGIQIKSQ